MTKRSRPHTLFQNAPGGPRLLRPDDKIDLDGIETSDGKPPNFVTLSGRKLREFEEEQDRLSRASSAPIFVHQGKGSHPDLFDTLVNDMPEQIDDAARIRPLLFQAKHFVLDPAACQFISKLAAEEELLDQLVEFALPPHDKMAITHRYGADYISSPLASFDGHPRAFQSLTLWDRGMWKLFVAHEDGSSLAAIPGWCRNMPGEGRMVMNEIAIAQDDMETAAKTLGSLRLHRSLIDAFFLLMAQPKVYQIAFNEARRSLHKGKVVKFFARSQIKIDLAEPKGFRRLFHSGTHASPRWHEVRAHFVHFGGDLGCTHDWEPVDSDDGKKRWSCARCGRKRCERRLPNGRGDAAKGFVRQSYEITAS